MSGGLGFYVLVWVGFEVLIGVGEMFVWEERVVWGKRRRVWGCE